MIIDLATTKPGHIYGLMTQTLVPRPVAWVLSDNGDGGYNLAPFSFFTGISSRPPLLALSIGLKKGGSPKDTRANIQARQHFVIHIPQVPHYAHVEASAEALPAGESEITKLGLPLVPFAGSPLPRLKACHVAMACQHHQTVLIDGAAQVMILGRIHTMYVADEIIDQEEEGEITIETRRLDPLARLGAGAYASVGDTIAVP